MYDYIKLYCPEIDPDAWINNRALDFVIKVSKTTGEVIDEPISAKLKNLNFKMTPSKITTSGVLCTLAGSLHKFHNDGLHNKNRFYFSEFIATVNHLAKHYAINPNTCEVKNFEYGLNIQLPDHITAKQFINDVVCLPAHRFATMNVKNVKFGKVANFNDYDLKLYDKADPDNPKSNPLKNIIRVEIRVKKLRFLEASKYNLKEKKKPLYLADLMRRDFTTKMAEILAGLFNEIIFYDHTIKIKHLTNHQQKKVLQFQNPLYWENLNHKQRHKQKQQYTRLMAMCGASDIKTIVHTELMELSEILINSQPEKRGRLHQDSGQNQKSKKGTFAHFKCWVHSPPRKNRPAPVNTKSDQPQHPGTKSGSNIQKHARTCKTCGRDISHQRPQSLFCSEKYFGTQAKQCRNKASNKTRKTRIKDTKAIENENLIYFIEHMAKFKNIKLLVSHKRRGKEVNTRHTIDTLKVATFSPVTVTKIKVYNINKPFVVTTRTAKTLYKFINNTHMKKQFLKQRTKTELRIMAEKLGIENTQKQPREKLVNTLMGFSYSELKNVLNTPKQ